MLGVKAVHVPEATREIGPYKSAWAGFGGFPILPYSLGIATVSPLEWIFFLDLAAPVSHIAGLLLETQRMAVLLVETDDQTIPITRVVKREDAARYAEYWRATLAGQEPPGMELGLVMPFTRATPIVTPLRVLWRAVWDSSYGQWESLGNALEAARAGVGPEPIPVIDKSVFFPLAGR